MFEENNTHLVKKIKALLRGLKRLKMVKTHFWQKLKNEAFDLKIIFLKRNLKQTFSAF